MSRSQGAANSGWPVQRHPAGEPDPRTGGRPAQRPQQAQAPHPQGQHPQVPHPQAPHPQAHPQAPYQGQQQHSKPAYPQAPQSPAPQYAVHPQQAAPGYAQPGYGDQHAQQPAPYGGASHPGYHYPQQAAPQYAGGQQYAAPQPQTAPAAPAPNRQALSSLDSARNAQPTHDFENFPRTQPPQYTRPPQQAQRPAYTPPAAVEALVNGSMGYQQSAPTPQYAPQRQAAPSYDGGWPAQQPGHDPYGQDAAGYLQDEASYSANGNQPHMDPLQQADWTLPANGYADPGLDPSYGRAQHGYDQAHGGALEPTYNQDEAAYEADEPRRASWTMRIAGAVVVAIGLGYGGTQAYKAVLGSPPDQVMPVIASDSSPAKEEPLDPGGRKFSHTDSKVLGRLGQEDHASAEASDGGLSESDTSGGGTRPVKTLVVGRDGSIAAPSSGEQAAYEPEPTVSVPGLTVVDAFGSAGHQPPQQRVAASEPEPQPEPAVVNSQPRSGVNVKTTRVIPTSTASLPDDDPAPAAAAPKKQKVAAADAAAGPTGANGYVVVLASVPASGSSRLDALRKFADMQQQYGAVLANKTPDVRETNLAGKGPYHRLLVGPPGSRNQASELCTQLKAYGYKDCWVTAY